MKQAGRHTDRVVSEDKGMYVFVWWGSSVMTHAKLGCAPTADQ